jgi:starch synthase
MFLMPSAFEPCGLSQLISLKYGTVPIVRATGGLDDTICGYPLENGNGFKFWDYNPYAMMDCLRYAIDTYKNKDEWSRIVKNAMNSDFSWDKSAKIYVDAYQNT